MTRLVRRTSIIGTIAVGTIVAGSIVKALTGPSSSQSPYLVPSITSVSTSSILTVGDLIGTYKMIGLPDGMGAFDNGDGTITLVMNHELQPTQGVTRAHGAKGAFVSRWIIEKDTLKVLAGSDLMQHVHQWNTTTQASEPGDVTIAFNRFCSGDLPEITAFFNPATGLGTQERIYMHGEESGSNGFALASVVTGPDAGNSYILGKLNPKTNGTTPASTAVGAWENTLANPFPQDNTVVIGDNDGGTGVMTNAVVVYQGTKQSTGTEADKAGLTNGTLKFVKVEGITSEIANSTTRATNITNGTRFALSSAVSTAFSRPEDGAWNPLNPNQYYFVTTDQIDQVSDNVGSQIGMTRLWRLTFDDITNPDAGGVIDLLIDGRSVNGEKVNMFDNITVNKKSGVVVLQEDPGGNAHNAKVWVYDPATDKLTRVAHHDRDRFGDLNQAATSPFTNDEESSGVIDVSSIFGPGYYIADVQAHYPTTAELVEGGQLDLLRLPFPIAEDKNRCKNVGWTDLFRKDGSTFKNQGDCIQYVNTGK